MAFDIKKFTTRALSAVVFVVVLLGSVLWHYASFSVFFLVVSLWGLHEFYQLSSRLGYSPYRYAGFIAAAFLYLSFVNAEMLGSYSTYLIPPFIILLIVPVLMVMAVFDQHKFPVQNALFTIGGLVYAVLPFSLLHQLVIEDEGILAFTPGILIGVILLIWSNDTFAYLGGSFFGKNKMIERVSPGKTWEGTIIGVLVTFGLSFLLPHLIAGSNAIYWMVCGLLVPVLATLGDLLESLMKRYAGVKDSGNIMPGHGGILDRFDSLIFVSPFAVVLAEVIC